MEDFHVSRCSITLRQISITQLSLEATDYCTSMAYSCSYMTNTNNYPGVSYMKHHLLPQRRMDPTYAGYQKKKTNHLH